MKKCLKIGRLALSVMLLCTFNSCELQKISKRFLGKEKVEDETSNQSVPQKNSYEKREPKVVKTFEVEARIYRVVGRYPDIRFKRTEHVVPMGVKYCDDGKLYTIEGGVEISYSQIPGYEYELLWGTTLYEFNTDEVY